MALPERKETARSWDRPPRKIPIFPISDAKTSVDCFIDLTRNIPNFGFKLNSKLFQNPFFCDGHQLENIARLRLTHIQDEIGVLSRHHGIAHTHSFHPDPFQHLTACQGTLLRSATCPSVPSTGRVC